MFRFRWLAPLLLAFPLLLVSQQPQTVSPEDRRRFAEIKARHDRGTRFPNLKQGFLTSRIYAGYASTPLNPEPHAYETAFADKWLIAEQIAGKSDLQPWLAWGPYLWADGMKPRQDGLIWTREDLGPDGTHPSPSGQAKVAKLLLEFFNPAPRPSRGL